MYLFLDNPIRMSNFLDSPYIVPPIMAQGVTYVSERAQKTRQGRLIVPVSTSTVKNL